MHTGVDGMCMSSEDGEDMRPVKMSALTFVDLAGSERMNQLDREESAHRARQTEVRMRTLTGHATAWFGVHTPSKRISIGVHNPARN